MTKVILVTPGIDYESFMDPDYNPLFTAKTFVANGDDEYKEALRAGLLAAFDVHGYDEDWHPLVAEVKKPVEPSIKLSEANTPRAEKLQKTYEAEVANYEQSLKAQEKFSVLFDGSSLSSVSVNELEAWVKKYQDTRTDGEISSLYIYEA